MKGNERFVESYCHQGRIGVLVEFAFLSAILPRCQEFTEAAKNIAMHIASESPTSLTDLKHQRYIKAPGYSVAGYLSEVSRALGEQVEVSRFIRWQAGDPAANLPVEPHRPQMNPRPKQASLGAPYRDARAGRSDV